MGPTNVVMNASDLIDPESMTPEMRMVILTNGDVRFVNTNEEYQQLMTAGLIVGADK